MMAGREGENALASREPARVIFDLRQQGRDFILLPRGGALAFFPPPLEGGAGGGVAHAPNSPQFAATPTPLAMLP